MQAKEESRDKIIIVDSDPDTVLLYQLILRDTYCLLVAQTNDFVLELIEEHEVKLIIVDSLQISDSVIHFLEKMASEYPHIQRILITTQTNHQLIMDAINKGRIFNYLSKPFDSKKMRMAVQKAIDQYDLSKSNQDLLENLRSNNKALEVLLAELKSEEEKFRNIFNASPDPIFIIDKEGIILENNEHTHSYFRSELAGVSIYDIVVTADIDHLKKYLKGIGGEDKLLIEARFVLKSERSCEFEINGYPVKYKGFETYMIALRDLSERKEMEKRVLQSIIQTEEKERRRFSQELHDGIGPLLSTTKLYLQWFNKPDSKMDKSIIISKMEETLEETIASLREVSNNISPNTLMSFGLNTALKTFINRIRNASDITFKYKNNLSNRPHSDIEVSIYRLCCECINNSLKHAEANKIHLFLNDQEGELVINYSDDGRGFDMKETLINVSGSGLLNMKTRVESLGGTISIITSPGEGTKINILFPVEKNSISS